MADPARPAAPRRLESLQALRGVAAVLVLLLHALTVLGKYGPDGPARSFLIGHAGVDLFFVISGFVMALTMEGRRGAGEAWAFLKRRAARIYPTYWVYLGLVLATQAVRPSWVNASVTQHAGVLPSALLIPTDGTPWLQIAWTLEYEVLFYLVVALGVALVPRRLSLAVVGAVLGLVAVGAVASVEPEWLQMLTGPMMLEFAMGMAAARLFQGRRVFQGRRGGVGLAGVGVALLVAEGCGLREAAGLALPGAFARPIVYGIPCALLVLGVASWERSRAPRWPRSWLAVGDASYTLYLSHLLVLGAVGRAWAAAVPEGVPGALLLALLVAVPIAFSLVAFWHVERPLIAWASAMARRRPLACGIEGTVHEVSREGPPVEGPSRRATPPAA